MEGFLYELPPAGVLGLVVLALVVVVGFILRQFLNDPTRKAAEDKALLKELLEGFGLEVPPELKEAEGNVIKPIEPLN